MKYLEMKFLFFFKLNVIINKGVELFYELLFTPITHGGTTLIAQEQFKIYFKKLCVIQYDFLSF